MGKVLLVELTWETSHKTENINWNWIILTKDQKPGWKKLSTQFRAMIFEWNWFLFCTFSGKNRKSSRGFNSHTDSKRRTFQSGLITYWNNASCPKRMFFLWLEWLEMVIIYYYSPWKNPRLSTKRVGLGHPSPDFKSPLVTFLAFNFFLLIKFIEILGFSSGAGKTLPTFVVTLTLIILQYKENK